jgi:hypothetical protein
MALREAMVLNEVMIRAAAVLAPLRRRGVERRDR